VARMLDALLSGMGLRVGRYTSPHLQLVTERISVDGTPISPERYVEAYRDIEPYVALVDGLCLGGGMGLVIHGAHRVVSERALLAMPETAIGLFPDVGATRFLNRCPGRVGHYLGLAGARLRAADALYCGLATNVAAQDRIEALAAAPTHLPITIMHSVSVPRNFAKEGARPHPFL